MNRSISHLDAEVFALHETRRSALQTDNDILAPAFWEIGALALLLLAYIITAFVMEAEALETAGLFGSVLLAAILFGGAWRMAMRSALVLWMGLFWFRISMAVYFGIGSMVHIFFNAETARQSQAFFYAQPIHFLKLNICSTLGSLVVLATVKGLTFWRAGKPISEMNAGDDRILFLCAAVFSVLGYGMSYLVVIPNSLQLLGEAKIPASLTSLSLLAPVGLFMLTLWSVRHNPRYLILVAILMTADIVFGCMLFNKSEVIKPMLVVLLAMLQHRLSRTRLLIAGGIIIFTFSTIVPLVEYGRAELSVRHGNIQTAPLSERFDIFYDYLAGERLASTGEDFQGGLARIAYASSSAPAIAFYDNGEAGDSLSDILYVFIPRVLWPGKPIFDVGARYNERVNGSNRSASWMGLFAEGYWNFGWFGVVMFGVFYAGSLYATGVMTIGIISESRWLHFPIALFGLYMGIRTDGSFVLEMAVSFVICLLVQVIASAGDGLIRPFFASRRRLAGAQRPS